MAEIEYEIREQDLLAFNDHQMKSSERLQKTMRRHQATIPAVMILISLIIWFYYQDSLSAIWVAISGGAWGLLVPYYLRWDARNQIKKFYTDELKSSVLGTYKLRAESKHLVEIGSGGESRIKWSDILRIETTRNYAFIFVTLDSALIVPRKTVKSGNLHEFVKEADQRIEQAA
jgi:hypothetical protein